MLSNMSLGVISTKQLVHNSNILMTLEANNGRVFKKKIFYVDFQLEYTFFNGYV